MPRVLTLTLNPCVDRLTTVPRVEPEKKLRAERATYEPGGGGVNVARAVGRLGGEAHAIYLAGGQTGDLLAELLNPEPLTHHRIPIAGQTRLNDNFTERASGDQFRFIMPGPVPTADDVQQAAITVLGLAREDDLLVVSGSLAQDTPGGLLNDLLDEARRRGLRVVLDTSGEPLRQGLKRGVYLIKPNRRELAELTGQEPEDERDIRVAALQLVQEQGAEVVVISLGGSGAILAHGEHTRRFVAPHVRVRSMVGAGDSMIGGISLALVRGWDPVEAVRFGIASGAAAVQRAGTALCERHDAERLYEQMRENEGG